ncbi:MAG: deoxyribodipyrimidine photo-lyase [Candidatus Paceibacteria bacterium]
MKVDVRRVRILNDAQDRLKGPVVYVMAREQRVKNNWALLYALEQANTHKVPLLVLFAVGPMFNDGSSRHNEWMIKSLQDVESDLKKFEVPFFVRCGVWSKTVCGFAHEYEAEQLVLDFNPLEPVRSWRDELVALFPKVSIVEVDARNIVPCWMASDKAEFSARTIRPKIKKLLPEFLVPYPRLTSPKVSYNKAVPKIDWAEVRKYRQSDYSISVPTTYIPGTTAGEKMVKDFINNRLKGYATRRNNPNVSDGVSHLSPYLRWGNISAQAVALAVETAEAQRSDKVAFLEELIVRRELSDNFCFYTENSTKVAGAHAWAQKTIKEHSRDKREYIYTLKEFETQKTHDLLWNAAQRQMMEEGKMHGFLRMYWAKKILEWTPDAQTAIDIALYLNDKYSLDGRDSNGVVGVMWSICGVHDRAWNERPVFGKIRYMNYAGCKRKFKVKEFEARYGQKNRLHFCS